MRSIYWSLLLLSGVVSRQGLPAEPSALPSSDKYVSLAAGDLVVTLNVTQTGVHLVRVQDESSDTLLSSNSPLPLFSIKFRAQSSDKDATVNAGDGWTSVRSSQPDDGIWTLEWLGHEREGLSDLAVRMNAHLDGQASAVSWTLHVDLPSKTQCVRSVVFPQLAIHRFGPDAEVFYPRAAGEVKCDLWQRPFTFAGPYPTGWTSMQLMAVYDSKIRTGLYFALHDPSAVLKNLSVRSQPGENSAILAYEHPAPRMDQPGKRILATRSSRLAGPSW